MTVQTVPARINDRWDVQLLPHRARFHAEHPSWEAERLASMHGLLRPGMTIIDVGAEEGDLPALWASWGCRVGLIEPSPGYWPAIRATFTANGVSPAFAFEGFASDETALLPPRPAHEALGRRDGIWPRCSLGEVVPDVGFCHLAQQRDAIAQVRLDAIAPHDTDAITIDVEGAEFDVLMGAPRLLEEARPLVWVSVHTDEEWMRRAYPDKGLGALCALMASHRYRGERLATDHEDHWLFVPEERAP